VRAPDEQGGSAGEDDSAELSAAAERSRRRLHEEMERVRLGVEEMLTEQEHGGPDPALRRELDAIREQTRRYVKRRVRKAEKRVNRSLRDTDERIRALERRIEAVEQERRYAEWRIHTSTAQILDAILHELRATTTLFTRAQ
jgi:hypothetical protein